MASLDRRVASLEAGNDRERGTEAQDTPYYLERYFKELSNLRRSEAGLEPLPYTPQDLEDDRGCLEDTIPRYRESPGWQTEAAKNFLDQWEQHIRENLKKGTD
jgi:hypothetical protein